MDQSAPSPPAGTWHTAKIGTPPSSTPTSMVLGFQHIRLDFPRRRERDHRNRMLELERRFKLSRQAITSRPPRWPLQTRPDHRAPARTDAAARGPPPDIRVPACRAVLAAGAAEARSATLDAINEALGLSNHYHHYSSVLSGASGMFQMPDEGCIQPPPGPDFSSITTMLSYIPATNTTHGIPYFDPLFTQFYNIIAEFEMCPHPLLLLLLLLLLPLLACELTLDINVDRLERYQMTLEQMGGDGDDLLDHRMLVTHLSKARSWVHLALATLRSTQWCVEFILKKIDWVDERLTPETRGRLKNMYGGGSMQMDAPRALRERAALITQNDSLLSTSIAQDSGEIAAASKRDSSSMKISAFLTTFVLPATFVAQTFFSMPLFDWDTPSINHVATRHFWVFWALAGPLTLATMAGTVAWAVWHLKNTRDTQKKERIKI
ncbi:hypothetical protein BDW71DRAFT_209515 [Aspergillus fruticulosus]